MYNANISFPLKIGIGAEQTGQRTWGDSGPHLMEVLSLNTYIRPINVTGYVSKYSASFTRLLFLALPNV